MPAAPARRPDPSLPRPKFGLKGFQRQELACQAFAGGQNAAAAPLAPQGSGGRLGGSMADLAGLLLLALVVTGMALGFAALRVTAGPAPEPQKIPFLGGAAPGTHAWQRYHVRYYSMTLLFVAFEMEMMFMYPWAAVFVEEGIKAMVEMGMFLTILSLGILYGWREGIFRWQ
jgi:NADH-quinone oxidoreductase subunit A